MFPYNLHKIESVLVDQIIKIVFHESVFLFLEWL